MRGCWKYVIILLLLLSGFNSRAQNPNNLIATKNKLVLLIDLNSSEKDLDTIFKNAAINGVDARVVIKGNFSAIFKDGWTMVRKQNNIIQFDKPLKDIKANAPENPFVITGETIKNDDRHGYMDDAVYGVNNFSNANMSDLQKGLSGLLSTGYLPSRNATIFDLQSGITRFNLPGYLNAKRVFLSGGFNDWSTLKGKMTKTPTGWYIDIKLQPGAWMYKFIINSNWTVDPNNTIQLDDGAGNTNSVYYKYNYIFKLSGYASAQKVTVTGSFNGWKGNQLVLQKKKDGWELPLYLSEGTHTYRFVVDGKPITDPANPQKFKNSDGSTVSVIGVGQTVYFALNGYINARLVNVAGNFNNWNPNGIALKRSGNKWIGQTILPAGNYSYKFIVDGDWMTDPANPVQTINDGQVNSFLAVNANHTFKLKGHNNAKVVHLAGNFNKWNPNEFMMGRNTDGWSISMYLKPGKCLYKFIVDDNWIIDPGNSQWEQNEFATGNSVFWME